jgi:excisionase family DNA binding protein
MGRNLTTEEVAERFRTVPETVRYWRHIGKIRGFKVGRRVLYDEAEVDALVTAAKREAANGRGDAA